MAHMKAANSLAIAVVVTWVGLPLAISRRYLVHSRTWAFQAIFHIFSGRFSCRSRNLRLTRAGNRYDHAACISIRLACPLPVLVILPSFMLSLNP
jgi:hypothetical protein